MNKKLFSAMSRRRVSSPQTTQQLWDAIRITSYQRQIPDINRISRYMSRIHGVSEDEVRRQLSYCVRDGLIRLVKRLGFKGKKIGVEQESYRLPKPKMLPRDQHDWYCFECHSGGDVISCTSCHRVYHLACIEKEDLPDDDVKNKFICNVCKSCEGAEENLKRVQLNKLLTFTCARLKEKLPATIMDRMVPSNSSYISDRTSSVVSHQRRASGTTTDSNIKWVSDEADAAWRIRNLIFCPMDLHTMEVKAQKKKYRSLEQFRADAQTIVHNVVIYHGVHSPLADMARQMLRDCNYDVQEIRQCRDCYRMSNEKLERHWFCQPCRPPHQLVYAKQKGFPYWPAKVIKIDGDRYDVRFFGGHHQRAIIEKAFIRQISVNIHSLQVKKTSSWNKACEELKRHQTLLEEMRQATNDFTKFETSEDEAEEEEEEEEEEDISKLEKENIDEEDEEDEEEEENEEHDDQDEDGEEVPIAKEIENAESAESAPVPSPTPPPPPPLVADHQEQVVEPPKKRGRKRKHKENIENETSNTPEEDALISSTSVKRKSKKDGTSQEDMVTSSCEEPVNRSFATQTNKKASAVPITPSKDIAKAVKEALEKQRREFDEEKAEMEEERAQAIANAVRSLEQDLGRMQTEHAEVIADLEEKHRATVSEVKKKQWCYNCELEAIYHCCWNTAYCSIDCQQNHWQKEHKRVCRRKR